MQVFLYLGQTLVTVGGQRRALSVRVNILKFVILSTNAH